LNKYTKWRAEGRVTEYTEAYGEVEDFALEDKNIFILFYLDPFKVLVTINFMYYCKHL